MLNYLLHERKMKGSSHCDCGQIHTIRHIAEKGPQTRCKRGVDGFHKVDEEAIDWLFKIYVYL